MIISAQEQFVDLAPGILRQRLVVEGTPQEKITKQQIEDYLFQLAGELDMTALDKPVTHRSPLYGWAGWVHWETSGAHFYAWDQPTLFMSVDIYTCKAFSETHAVEFTKDFFKLVDVAYRGL